MFKSIEGRAADAQVENADKIRNRTASDLWEVCSDQNVFNKTVFKIA